MFLRLSTLILSLAFCFSSFAQYDKVLDVDFVHSMTDGSKKAEDILTEDKKYAHYLKILQDNYNAKAPSKMAYNETPLIPKIMHHVWIGGGEVPPLYQNYLNECRKLYPDWEFKIWGDKEVAELGLEYKDLYDKSRLYPGKTDILRFEILDRFGGVYRDMDIKCYRPIDDLNHKYELYSSLEYPGTWKRPAINTGLLASKAGHPMLRKMLDYIRDNIDRKLEDFDNGVQSYSTKNIQLLGVDLFMLPFTDVFINNVSLNDKNIAFPATYFLPLAYNSYEQSKYSKLIHRIFKTSPNMQLEFVKPESLMWHNILKNEIRTVSFDYGNGISDPSRRRLLKKLSPSSRQTYQMFKSSYSDNNTNKISNWSKKSKTPQVINFVVFNDDEMLELNKNLPDWKMFNGDFEINIWDKAKISSEFPELKDFNPENLVEELRFYVGLKILESSGGTYANFNAMPHNSIFELNNKYNFYAGLAPINKSTTEILFSKKLIGASARNPIIAKTLSKIDIKDLSSLRIVNSTLTREAYKNMYLNGKNIVLPAIYFEPIDKLEDDYLYMVPDYTIRFFKNIPKSFTDVTGYSVIE